MATTFPASKNGYTTMRNLEQFVNSFKLPNIQIMVSPLTDDITIYNTDNHTSRRITRYALEDAVDPKAIILETISNLMAVPINQLGDIIKEAITRKAMSTIVPTHPAPASGAVYVSDGTGPIWVSSGGGGGGGGSGTVVLPSYQSGSSWVSVGTGGAGSGAIGGSGISGKSYYTAIIDDIYAETNSTIRNSIFTPAEQDEIRNIKYALKSVYLQSIPTTLLYNEKVVVAGGCFASWLHNEKPHDIDIFILNDERTNDYIKNHIDTTMLMRPNEIKLGNTDYLDNKNIEYTAFDMRSKCQFITTKYKTRAELIAHFDMLHCCVSYMPYDDKLYITREIYDTIKNKKIVSNQSRILELVKPWRIDKMQKRGWKI